MHTEPSLVSEAAICWQAHLASQNQAAVSFGFQLWKVLLPAPESVFISLRGAYSGKEQNFSPNVRPRGSLGRAQWNGESLARSGLTLGTPWGVLYPTSSLPD